MPCSNCTHSRQADTLECHWGPPQVTEVTRYTNWDKNGNALPGTYTATAHPTVEPDYQCGQYAEKYEYLHSHSTDPGTPAPKFDIEQED